MLLLGAGAPRAVPPELVDIEPPTLALADPPIPPCTLTFFG